MIQSSKNVHEVVTERTPSCFVHLDISKSSDCIISHGRGSRKWIMLRDGQRSACKGSPTSFTPSLPLCICSSKISFSRHKIHLKHLEPGEWDGLWEPLSFPTFTLLLSHPCGWMHNRCTAGPKEDWLHSSNTPDPGASALPFPKRRAHSGGYLANALLGRDNLFLTCQLSSWSLASFCVPKGR